MRLEPVHEARCFAMPSRPIIKISQRHGFAAIPFCGSGPGIMLRQVLTPLQRVSIFSTVWRFICRLGASLEAIVLLPVTAIVVTPLLLYRLATRGYYAVLFASKRGPDVS
jgi:hypothetical protein